MKTYRMMISILVFLMLMVISAGVQATDLEALSAEGEAAAAASASVKATPQMIIEKVDKACEVLSREGRAAFIKFKGKDSEFIFADTYIWIHDMKGVMQMHPIKHKMEGKDLIGLKDVNGKRFFVEMNNIA
jgi:cytochrome c